jgi:triosephosphate isomerase
VGKQLIIANWKMNLNVGEASLFVHKLGGVVKRTRDVEVVIAPTLLALQPVSLQIHHHDFKLAAQNFYWRDDGAFTGEVSANQLRGLVQYGLVGHSERRHVFNEPSKDIRGKVQAAFRNNIIPVLCVGETAGERATGETNDILHDQLVGGLSNITGEEVEHLVVAYEPVWAIGTGNNATSSDVETAVKAIRSQIRHLFGAEPAKKVRVLYGGSVTADNATSYMSIPGVDGLLIGGASLNVHTFADIVNQAHTLTAKGKK